jgi:hypothetical protein
MGIKIDMGFDFVETAKFATPVVNSDYIGKKVIGYDIAEDLVAILLDSNEVLWY